MFQSFNTEQMEEYFCQVNASLGKMPSQERSELHGELRQHLEALFAAHTELGASPEEALGAALRQFGEPRKIGRRMYQEWRRDKEQGSSFACLPAALYALAWIMGMEAVSFGAICLSENGYAGSLLELWAGAFAFYGIPLIAGLMTGWKFQERALPGVFYATLPFSAMLVLAYGVHPSLFGLAAFFWSPLSNVVAYGVSALRRGKMYQPVWSELLLRLK